MSTVTKVGKKSVKETKMKEQFIRRDWGATEGITFELNLEVPQADK